MQAENTGDLSGKRDISPGTGWMVECNTNPKWYLSHWEFRQIYCQTFSSNIGL